MTDYALLCTLPGECQRFSIGLTHFKWFTCYYDLAGRKVVFPFLCSFFFKLYRLVWLKEGGVSVKIIRVWRATKCVMKTSRCHKKKLCQQPLNAHTNALLLTHTKCYLMPWSHTRAAWSQTNTLFCTKSLLLLSLCTCSDKNRSSYKPQNQWQWTWKHRVVQLRHFSPEHGKQEACTRSLLRLIAVDFLKALKVFQCCLSRCQKSFSPIATTECCSCILAQLQCVKMSMWVG